jgi:hypothetical protein
MSGMFRDRSSAEKAYQVARRVVTARTMRNLLMSDETRKTHFGDTPLIPTSATRPWKVLV